MKKTPIVIFIFALAGMLFSGYLSFVKLFSGTCSLTEGCTYFLGYPTCIFGFIFFLTLFILSIFYLYGKARKAIFWVSLLAIIFSGYFTIVDIQQWTGHYSLGLPSCIYGLIMFVIIFISSSIKEKQ